MIKIRLNLNFSSEILLTDPTAHLGANKVLKEPTLK